jgi:MFS family permease
MLIVCRSIQGLGSAMLTGNSIALITAIFPSKDRGRVFGINVAAVYIGMSLGPFLGGILTESFGWRSIFLITIPVGILVLLLLFWKVKGEWYESKGEKFDYSGSAVYAIALVALIYGFSILPGLLGIALIMVGIGGLLAFVKWESRAKSPVLNIGIFRNNKTLIFSNLAALINFSATTAVVFLLSLYLQYIKALTPEQAGLVLIAQPVIQAIFSPFTGRLSDKLEPRVVASAGMALTFIGLILFSFLTKTTPILQVVIILIMVGAGLALFSSPNANAIMSSVVPKYYGVASSLIATIRSIGQTMSMGITMIVMALIIGRVVITPEAYPALLRSTQVAFIIFSVLCFGGIFASIHKDKPR